MASWYAIYLKSNHTYASYYIEPECHSSKAFGTEKDADSGDYQYWRKNLYKEYHRSSYYEKTDSKPAF